MRKIAVIGAAVALAIGAATGAQAATQEYIISNGLLSNSVNSCFNIAVSLTGTDCSYARTRSPSNPTPSGPKFTAGFYAKGTLGDNVAYTPLPGDGKATLAVTGTVTIDDNDTPSDGSDDLISATWTIAAGVHNASTGNGDRGLERWDAWTHVMAPTAVNAATDNGGGSFTYRIGSRGNPTPAPLCAAADPSDCFPTENAPLTQDPPGFWETTFSSLPNPAINRNGIERTRGFGLYSPNLLNPNIGAQTTGSFTNYECIDLPGDNDCIGSEILLGSSSVIYRNEDGTVAVHPALGNCSDTIDNDGGDGADGADPQCVPLAVTQPTNGAGDTPVSPPGFENLILILTTNGQTGINAAITSAQAFWTREYIIASGPAIGTDVSPNYDTENSYGGGRFTFTGAAPQDAPVAFDDDVNVPEDASTPIAVLANDTPGGGTQTITIVAGEEPVNGTAVVNGDNVVYTPDLYYSGPDSFMYRVTDQSGDQSVATVTVTVAERVPVAGNFVGSSRNGVPSAAIPVLGNPTQLGTGTSGEHTVTATGAATGGTCVAAGNAVVFTPAAGFNGAGSCDFEIEDADGDTDVGTLTVSVSGNGGGGGGGGGGPQLPGGGSSLDALGLAALLAGLPIAWRRRRR
ncbi:MAG: hypothetical protein FJ197_07105 [Gammaproteobacteria bacterium]|nr:hypothetical protein [Gammaproteobacteria bacterium]